MYLYVWLLKQEIKVSTADHAIEEITSVKLGELRKTQSQVHTQNNKKKWQIQTELIEQQKQEIEKLKAIQDPGIFLQQLVKAITQAMLCMYRATKKPTSAQETGENHS